MNFEDEYYLIKEKYRSHHAVKPSETTKRRGIGKLCRLDKMSRNGMKNSRKYQAMKSKTKIPRGSKYRHL